MADSTKSSKRAQPKRRRRSKPLKILSNSERGKRLLVLRHTRRVSQTTLGQIAGASQRVISKIECGRQDMKGAVAFRLAQFFDVPVSHFYNPKDAA